MAAVFLKILNMSITAGWLMLAVMVLRLILKKAPKWISCMLWALVAIRLICPFSIESALSLIPAAEPVSGRILSGPTLQISTEMQMADAPVNDFVKDSYLEDGTVPAKDGKNMITVLGSVWLAGIVLLLMYSATSYYKVYRRTRVSICMCDTIFKCDEIDTPFILGVFKPHIYLPSGMEEARMEYVIAHEKAHLKRHDHWWKPAGFLLLIVYWFHPLCWISYMLFCRDIELACDEHVIKAMDLGCKKSYANALLSCSVKEKSITACPLAFGEVGVKQRIRSVLTYRRPAFWMVLVSVIVCIAAAICFLTNPIRENEAEWEENAGAEGQGMVMQDVDVPEEVLAEAKQYVEKMYKVYKEGEFDYGYTNWRIEHLEYSYTYDNLEGKVLEIYQMNFEFLSSSPEDVILLGGMTISEDNWVMPEYRDSTYLVFIREENELLFLTVMLENDCYPGDKIFTEDLRQYLQDNEQEEPLHQVTEEPINVIERFGSVNWNDVEELTYSDDIPDLSGILCIGEIPERGIKVYGYNDEEIMGRGIAIEIGEDVNYFDWYYTTPRALLPDLFWEEESRRLQISFHTYTGTGLAAENLYVLQYYDTGTLQPSNFNIEKYSTIAAEKIGYTFDEADGRLTLVNRETEQELVSVEIPEGKVTELELGCISEFHLGETITFQVWPGYFTENSAVAQYENMPILEFEVIMEALEYGDIMFDLGEVKIK